MIKIPAFWKTAALFVAAPVVIFLFAVLGLLGTSIYVLAQTQSVDIIKRSVSGTMYSVFTAQPPILGVASEKVAGQDGRAAILTQFFARHKAPLSGYAANLVESADKYGLDWKLLPAIAMQESNGGKVIPANSHNAWGWAIHSTYTKKFDTWESAIETVANGMATDYLSRGLVTPCQIMTRYNPISTARDGSWCKGVEYFIGEIESF